MFNSKFIFNSVFIFGSEISGSSRKSNRTNKIIHNSNATK